VFFYYSFPNWQSARRGTILIIASYVVEPVPRGQKSRMAEDAGIGEDMEGIEIEKIIMIGGMAFIPRNGTFVPVPREKVETKLDLKKDSRNGGGNGKASGELVSSYILERVGILVREVKL